MATSPRTLDQVRSILGKLDRRIDALREARGEGPRPRQPEAASPAPAPAAPLPMNPGDRLIGLPSTGVNGSTPRVVNAPAQNLPPMAPPSQGTSPTRSLYGKATPLRP